MSRILPFPLFSLSLLVMWLLLTGSLELRSILFGALLGLIVPQTLRRLDAAKPRIRNPRAIVQLFFVVLKDIVRSNIAVASIILGRKKNERISGFLHVPLDIQNTYALVSLAIIVTCTPGTLWVQYDSGRKRLLLHVLDLVDEEEWVNLIKNRYERLLMEIFE